MSDARCLSGAALAAALRDSRARTLSLLEDLSDAQWQVPQRAGVNPPAWELSHLAWFAEFWTLRGPHCVGLDGFVHAARPPRLGGRDALFDSARLPHAARWTSPMPARAEVLRTLDAQLAACLAAIAEGGDDQALYFHRLVLFHEDMHGEAFCWLRAALGYPAPAGAVLPRFEPRSPVEFERARVCIGWPPTRRGFAFDNELASFALELHPYEIDATPVTAGQFLQFVEAGGYEDARWWPQEAGAWRASAQRTHPARWRKADRWQHRWFDRWLPLALDAPVIHVNAWEAQAYCRWVGRRLPSAPEWEHAADRIEWGRSVWEWTSEPFGPYPGFVPGPYKDYSAPWFGDHRELRGGAFATHARLHDRRYRNFFVPARDDVFAGFRTARSLTSGD